jgi:hypothetical protein
MGQSVYRLGYWLDNRGIRLRLAIETRDFSLPHKVKTSSGAHSASYTVGTCGYFPSGKAAGA